MSTVNAKRVESDRDDHSKIASWFSGFLIGVYFIGGLRILFDNHMLKTIAKLTNPQHYAYGNFRFLTNLTICAQLASTSLHVTVLNYPRLYKARDLVFTALALPLSVLVVITFWIVWLCYDREWIFPRAFDTVFPNWLNHISHTLTLPCNIFLLLADRHSFDVMRGLSLLFGIMMCYLGLIHRIKATTGTFVYVYLDKLYDSGYLFPYYVCVFFLLISAYFIARYANNVIHKKAIVYGVNNLKVDDEINKQHLT